MNFSICKVSLKNNKNLNLGQKLLCLGILGLGFEKSYCHIWNQHPQIFLKAKFHAKMKILKFRSKSGLFACFWAGIWKYYCHNWNQRPRFFLIANFGAKIKIIEFGTKIVLFGFFGQQLWKAIVIFDIGVRKFVLLQSLVQK